MVVVSATASPTTDRLVGAVEELVSPSLAASTVATRRATSATGLRAATAPRLAATATSTAAATTSSATELRGATAPSSAATSTTCCFVAATPAASAVAR